MSNLLPPIKLPIFKALFICIFEEVNENHHQKTNNIEMDTVGEKMGYIFWYFVLACSVCSLISSLYQYMN